MKKKLAAVFTVIVIALCSVSGIRAQNLVVDPGFESGTSCTDDFNITPGWDDGGGGGSGDTCATPDIFTPCGSVITAIFGSHTPHGGNNYAGAYLYVAQGFACVPLPTSNAREYIQGSLTTPMVAGQKYCVSFWVALSKNSPWAFSKIGVYFSNTHVVHTYCPGTGTGGTLLPFTPQLTWCGSLLNDTATWTQLKWTYTATGGEQYFIVGNFNTDANTSPVCVNSSAFFPMMYYFYDDFNIQTGCCPDSVIFSGVTSTGCGGASNGATAGVASATCGAGAYSYNWSNGTGGQTISSVSGNTYTVTVSTVSGCSATGSINLGTGLSLSAVAGNTGCSGNTGSVTTTTTGTGPYTYAWSNGATTANLSNVAAGSYQVTVSNGTGCSTSSSATVGTSGNLSLAPGATATTCNNSNGGASVTATGGSGYTYNWSNGVTTSSISNVPSGTYQVTVLASGGCSATSSVVVNASTGISLSKTVTATTCGNNNGAVSVAVNGGTSPYNYTWSGGLTGTGGSGLAPGTYNVTAMDSHGCSATASALVAISSALTLQTTAGRAGCVSSGTASVSVTAGTGPFTYLWSNMATDSSINSLSAGNYSVTVTGAGNCSASASATVISTGTGITLTSVSTASFCRTPTGSAHATATTGNGPFSYAWSNGQTTDTILNVAAGDYTVTVTGNSGCSATAVITVPTSGTVVVTATPYNATCGASNGAISAVIGGNLLSAYTWSNGATTDSISGLAAGTYTVTVVTQGGCSATASAIVGQSSGSITIATPNAICLGDTASICAPSGYASYHWNTGSTSMCVTTTQGGNYYVTASDNISCTVTSNHVTLTVNTPTGISIVQHGDSLVATGATTYQWYFSNTAISGATGSFYIPTQDGNYYVQATDANGCSETSNTSIVKTILGIDQVNAAGDIKVYPNPLATGNWHLDATSDWLGANCEFYDAAGRLVYRTEIRSMQSEFELNVAQGIYLMKVNSAQKNYTFKLIKL